MASKILLETDKYYHVFNHAIGDDLLFRVNSDYIDFMNRYKKHVAPIADTIAYCLIPNHFHFSFKIKSITDIFGHSKKVRSGLIIKHIYRCFSHFLNGYVQCYNKKYNRLGGLFIGNFKRKELPSDADLKRLICYIHNNPVEAGLVNDPKDWPYSSYFDIISMTSDPNISIWIEEHLRLFDDLDNFKFVHLQPYLHP